MLLILLRFSIGIILMAAIGLIIGHVNPSSMLRLQSLDKQDRWLFMLSGLLQPFLYFILETYSYQSFVTPTIAEAFLSTNPLMAPIFAWLFLRERVTKWNILGIVVSTVGMVLLVMAGSKTFAIGPFYAIPLALITVSTAVMYSILLKRIPAHYNALTIVFWVQLSGLGLFIFLVAIAFFCHTFSPQWTWSELFIPALQTIDGESLTGVSYQSAIWGVAYLSVLSTVTAFILFCYSVRFLGVTKANVFNNIRPVFTALLMWGLFREQLPVIKWGGIMVIIIGLFICQKHEK